MQKRLFSVLCFNVNSQKSILSPEKKFFEKKLIFLKNALHGFFSYFSGHVFGKYPKNRFFGDAF